MINIRRLKLHMPAGMEGRARNIARMVAHSLANGEVTKTKNIKNVTLQDVHIHSGMADHKIASTICSGIVRSIGDEK